jgi:hypothetical protein
MGLWHRQLLEGLFGSNIIGFQTLDSSQNRIDTVERSLDTHIGRRSIATCGDRRTAVGALSGVDRMDEPVGTSIAARRDLQGLRPLALDGESLLELVRGLALSLRESIPRPSLGTVDAKIHVSPMSSHWLRAYDSNYAKHHREY